MNRAQASPIRQLSDYSQVRPLAYRLPLVYRLTSDSRRRTKVGETRDSYKIGMGIDAVNLIDTIGQCGQ
jgi:hypothetical protein